MQQYVIDAIARWQVDGARKMSPETREALEGSIAKWEAIVAGTGEDEGSENCPLCHKFHRGGHLHYCRGCPVREVTGRTLCDGTPYIDYAQDDEDGGIAAAKAELEFLKSLRPKEGGR